MKNGLSKAIVAVALAALTATASALAFYYVFVRDANGRVIAILHCDEYGCYRM